jgi:hypothetical protein
VTDFKISQFEKKQNVGVAVLVRKRVEVKNDTVGIGYKYVGVAQMVRA